jgi:hypothetical protein
MTYTGRNYSVRLVIIANLIDHLEKCEWLQPPILRLIKCEINEGTRSLHRLINVCAILPYFSEIKGRITWDAAKCSQVIDQII